MEVLLHSICSETIFEIPVGIYSWCSRAESVRTYEQNWKSRERILCVFWLS